eukprot:CAMPEP_0181455732 /NCGR_PEP_ID=MMETSP1110-20121109/30907_1 /TAXON_ID=174948 /ORGANISM="Symbiodinium sp., Strain CCMP421" /LENGTH=134 /DNA_ID=CAMNT_0023580121 /DNA_START=101 /DNA_END=502 /DNA_ORIENTATION=+
MSLMNTTSTIRLITSSDKRSVNQTEDEYKVPKSHVGGVGIYDVYSRFKRIPQQLHLVGNGHFVPLPAGKLRVCQLIEVNGPQCHGLEARTFGAALDVISPRRIPARLIFLLPLLLDCSQPDGVTPASSLSSGPG